MLDRPASVRTRLAAPLALALAVLAAWLLLQALVFRSGLYWRAVEPDSNIGAVSHALAMLESTRAAGRRTVLVLGDSRVGEGVSGPVAGAGGDLQFVNLAVPGSTPRTWYYLLREIDRRGFDYAAVVVGTLYVPTDRIATRDWPLDPPHQVQLLGLRDLAEHPDRRSILFPEQVARDDLRALLADPVERLRSLRRWPRYIDDTVNYAGHGERLPDDVVVAPAEPLPPALARENADWQYRWLDRLRSRAASRGAPLIVFQLPRGPRAASLPPLREPAWPGIDRLPAGLFSALEQPGFFFDTLHLNREGRRRLSAELGARVRERLEAAPRP